MTIGEAAGWAALCAIGTLVISGIALALFFGGAGDGWGPVNDLFVALTLVLLVPVIVAVLRLAPDDIGPWFAILSWLAVLGVLVAAAGQLLLVAGVIGLQTSFVTGGAGIAPFVAWMAALAALVLTRDMLSVTVGWLLLGALLAMVLITLAWMAAPWWVTAGAGVLLLALLVAWLANLSVEVRAAV